MTTRANLTRLNSIFDVLLLLPVLCQADTVFRAGSMRKIGMLSLLYAQKREHMCRRPTTRSIIQPLGTLDRNLSAQKGGAALVTTTVA